MNAAVKNTVLSRCWRPLQRGHHEAMNRPDTRRRPLRFVGIARQTRRWANHGWELLFPPGCAACGQQLERGLPTRRLCPECSIKLTATHRDLCPICGAVADRTMVDQRGCPRCRHRKLRFEGVVSLGPYNGPLRRAVLRMKRPSGEALAIAVAHLLCDHVGSQIADLNVDLVVPIPMHWTRRWVRGTNSAEVIAEVVAQRRAVPIARRLLVRRRKTRPQFNLHPGERIRNIRSAFRLSAGYHFSAARVLLVDDILTTGATCNEVAKVLRAAGATRVAVAVVARAEG